MDKQSDKNSSNLFNKSNSTKQNDLNNNKNCSSNSINYKSQTNLSSTKSNTHNQFKNLNNLNLELNKSIKITKELSDKEIHRRLQNLVDIINKRDLDKKEQLNDNLKSNIISTKSTYLDSQITIYKTKNEVQKLPTTLNQIKCQTKLNSIENLKSNDKSDEIDQSFKNLSIKDKLNFSLKNSLNQQNQLNNSTQFLTTQSTNTPLMMSNLNDVKINETNYLNNDVNHNLDIKNDSNYLNLDNNLINNDTITRSKLNELRISHQLNNNSRIPPQRLVNKSGDLYIIESNQNVIYNSINSNLNNKSINNQLNKSIDLNKLDFKNEILNNQLTNYDGDNIIIKKLVNNKDQMSNQEIINMNEIPVVDKEKLSNILINKSTNTSNTSKQTSSLQTAHLSSSILECAKGSKDNSKSKTNDEQLIEKIDNAHVQDLSFETRKIQIEKSKSSKSVSSCNLTTILNTSTSNNYRKENVLKQNLNSINLKEVNLDQQFNLLNNNIKLNNLNSKNSNNSIINNDKQLNCDLINTGNLIMSTCLSKNEFVKLDNIKEMNKLNKSFNNTKLSIDFVNCDLKQTSLSNNSQSSEDEFDKLSNKQSKQLFINTNLNTNGLHHLNNQSNGLINQQSPSTTSSSTASSLSLPVDMDSIDDGIHLNNSIQEPSRSSRDYRTHEEFVYAMKEDLSEWLNNLYSDLQPNLNVHNFMDQIGTGVLICKHANNLICKAKQFYNQPDIINGNSQQQIINQSIDQTTQRRFSQCSAASSLSSSGSNNELSSLPVNLNVSYQQDLNNDSIVDSILNIGFNDENKDESLKASSFISTTSTATLKSTTLKSPKSSPQPSPKHRILNNQTSNNSKLLKASSTISLNSSIRNSTIQNNKLNQQQQQITPLNKKPLKQLQVNSESRLRTYSASRIPQFNSSTKINSIKKSTNSTTQSTKSNNKTSINGSKLPASPNRRSLATSASSTSLINSSINSSSSLNNSTNRLINNRHKTTNSSINSNNKIGLTSNKNLSFSSNSIYSHQIDKSQQQQQQQQNRINESPRRTINSKQQTKNSKLNVPLSRTQSTSSGLTTTNNSILNNSNNKSINLNKSIGNHSINNDNYSLISNQTLNSSLLNNNYLNLWAERQQKLKNLSNAELIIYRDNIKSIKGMNEWHARDNVANFITACRNLFKIRDCLLFETDDLVMRKNERSFILCMLEIARIGCVFGIAAPLIIQLEQEIDRELALEQQRQNENSSDCSNDYQKTSTTNSINKDTEICDSAISSDCELEEHSNQPQTQIVTNDLKSLHERVVELLSLCKCPSQFPMVKVSDGKYRVGESKVLIFVRILRNHTMVRVGGGWDCLSSYLAKHDPCRGCKSAHKTPNQVKVTISNNSFSSNRKLSCDSINSLTNNYANPNSPNRSNNYSKSNLSMNKDDNLSILITYDRCSTSVNE